MIILTPKRKFEVPVQAACISPDFFKGKDTTQISNFPVTEGNRNLKLGDLFEIQEDHLETPYITINGDAGKVKRIGQAMKTGEIVVNGDCGMHTGEKMSGGKITVNGNIGGWSGDDMKGGLIEVHGDAGDYLASPYRGTATGMKGGLIVVDGKVGSDVGCYLHGGVLKIKGGAGRFLGYHMSDGAILVDKECDTRAGALMTGGKIVITGTIQEVMPGFTIDSVKPKVKIDDTQSVTGPFYVFLGDLAEHGTGKLFVNKANNPQLKTYEKYL
ncbi:MAG TPA: formylmethanofuran dehydrogenase subunit C [Candidatus Acidoferrales bacterium]|nr:formylmethanofuran dehydrogenase subunit C [Candidatus Acidoferrales bacterium]